MAKAIKGKFAGSLALSLGLALGACGGYSIDACRDLLLPS